MQVRKGYRAAQQAGGLAPTISQRTLVLRVEMDPATEAIVRDYAKEMARWEQRVFGKWYSDFRKNRKDLSKSRYSGLITTKRISARALGKKGQREKCRVNVHGKSPNLYSLLITKGRRVEPAVPTRIGSTLLLSALPHLGMVMEGFLDKELREHRSHGRRVARRRGEVRARDYGSRLETWNPTNFYPRFKPFAPFHSGVLKWNMTMGLPASFTVSHPFVGKKRLSIALVGSDCPRYAERLQPLRKLMESGRTIGIQLKYHSDGTMVEGWYVHIRVPMAVAAPSESVDRVMGVDVGERNLATIAVLDGPGGVADRVGHPKQYSGANVRDALERQHSRIRRLKRAAGLGSLGASRALRRAKGKRARILRTQAHQISHDLVKLAVSLDVDAIAMEDLSDFTPEARGRRKRSRFASGKNRRIRRLLSCWNRGRLQRNIRYKAESMGLMIAGPQGSGICAKGTSSTCPGCGIRDWNARDRDIHRFSCHQPGCGFSDNDDVVGAMNIAARGWAYFHPVKKRVGSVALSAGRNPGGLSNHPPVPGSASAGDDPVRASALSGGASSEPQATEGGIVGQPSRFSEKAENGMRSAVPEGNRSGPTAGEGRGIVGLARSRGLCGSVRGKEGLKVWVSPKRKAKHAVQALLREGD
jgi:IS605 OrfB family transposase